MVFLIDENVSYGLAAALRSENHDVISIVENDLQGPPDDDVYTRAKRENAVIITRDRHFTNPVKFPPNETGGIIYLRHGNLASGDEIDLIRDFVNGHSQSEYSGRLVLLSPSHIYIR